MKNRFWSFPSRTVILSRVSIVVFIVIVVIVVIIVIIIVIVVRATFKNGISRERLSPWFCVCKYTSLRRLGNPTFVKVHSCRPAQPTYRPKMKKWDNFCNFWPINQKFGMRVHLMHACVTVMFGNDLTVF